MWLMDDCFPFVHKLRHTSTQELYPVNGVAAEAVGTTSRSVVIAEDLGASLRRSVAEVESAREVGSDEPPELDVAAWTFEDIRAWLLRHDLGDIIGMLFLEKILFSLLISHSVM